MNLPPEKKINPPGHHLKISNTLTRNSSHWEYLNPMRNLKLLENISLHPPPPKKEILNLQENEKHLSHPAPENFSTPTKISQPLPKISQPSKFF